MPRSDTSLAIIWFICTGFLAVSINAVARQLSDDLHAFQLVFFYNAMALPWFLSRLALKQKTLQLRTTRMRLYSLRALLEFTGFSFMLTAVSLIPLSVHTALNFTAPLLGSIAAVIFLGERGSIHRWLALLGGFIGVLIVAQPGQADYTHAAWLVLAGACCFAGCGVCLKKLTRTERSSTIVFYMLTLTALVSLPFAVSVWHWPSVEDWPWIILMGALVFSVQHTVSFALAKADLSLLQPFAFLNLVWATLYAMLWFDEGIDSGTIAGSAVIIGSTLYAAHHGRRHAQAMAETKASAMGN